MRTRVARLDIRTTAVAKATIEEAAHYVGTTTSAFILECAVEKATRILQQAKIIRLNESEGRRFLDLLDHPPEPTAPLKQLFQKHQPKE